MKVRPAQKNPLLFIFEPLEDAPGYFTKKLFGFDAAHIGEKIYLAVAGGEEPWNGLLVCTAREHHASLIAEFPPLAPHAVLGKWLYISQNHAEFESTALDIAALARRRDPRLGVVSKARQR